MEEATRLRIGTRDGELGGQFAARLAVGDPCPTTCARTTCATRVKVRVLGVVRVGADGASRPLTFVPSHRRLSHVGSYVAFPSGAVLRELASHHAPGA
jgi:hypothetical protein